MRNSMPLRWIEQMEASEVMSAARFEQPSRRSRRLAAAARAAEWLARLRSRLAPDAAGGWPLLRWRPALVRRPVYRDVNRRRDDPDYFCDW